MKLQNLVHILIGIVCIGLLPGAQAVVPAPGGGYPAFTTAQGTNALQSLTTGSANTAVGWRSLFSNVAGSFNTATGAGTLLLNTGDQNTAFGAVALLLNTTGSSNTAVGAVALLNNTQGNENTAIGNSALYSNTTGDGNVANGYQALQSNTTGYVNTATGYQALRSNTIGFHNTANGFQALASNTTGSDNTTNGYHALISNATGNNNTAVGVNALLQNTTGAANIALGVNAGSNLTTGNNNIDIGNSASAAEANTIRIGEQGNQTATFIAGISAAPVTGTVVVVNGSGHLGVTPSSARFKEAITSMDNASEALFSLKPVTFRYKKEIDPKSTAQFGLVAEDVEKVNADLVVRDAEGKVYTVRYDAVNAMLLNEFLKEHKKVEEQQATIVELKSNDAQRRQEIKALATTVNEQAAQIQKVSAQLEASKPAPQVVNNP